MSELPLARRALPEPDALRWIHALQYAPIGRLDVLERDIHQSGGDDQDMAAVRDFLLTAIDRCRVGIGFSARSSMVAVAMVTGYLPSETT